MSELEIEFRDLRWFTDPPEIDLCAHGSVFARIGPSVLSQHEDGDDWTLSAAALFLLRSVTEDHAPDAASSEFLIPCCGFNMWRGGDGRVVVPGCATGVDWRVEHEGGAVVVSAPDGASARLPCDVYRRLVFQLADQVSGFYDASPPRVLPEDEVDLDGYRAFWEEWRLHREGVA